MQKKVFLVVLIEHSFANIFSHVTVGNFRYFGVIVTRIEGIMIDIDRTNRFRRFLGLFKDLYSFRILLLFFCFSLTLLSLGGSEQRDESKARSASLAAESPDPPHAARSATKANPAAQLMVRPNRFRRQLWDIRSPSAE